MVVEVVMMVAVVLLVGVSVAAVVGVAAVVVAEWGVSHLVDLLFQKEQLTAASRQLAV